jgi:O-methyltransferase
MRGLLRGLARRFGYELWRLPAAPAPGDAIPDAGYYQPTFSPWLGYGDLRQRLDRVRAHTLISADRLYVLHQLALQARTRPGEFWECGVFRGGTALLLAEVLAEPHAAGGAEILRLFDSFAGMPETDPTRDLHRAGDFAHTSLEGVRTTVGHADIVRFHPGWIPQTFAGLESSRIAFAHVDVDVYRSILDCCAFIVPRLVPGGFIVVDDYGYPSCPGARQAVDEYFRDRPERPLVLATGQAVIFAAG